MYYSFNGLLHPVDTDKVNVDANAKNSEKPLESTTTVLHPLPKKRPTITAPHSTSQTTQHHAQQSATEKSEIRFNSAVGSKNSQKIDPFAEQNAKRAEKEKEQAKKRKKIITVSSLIGGLLVLGLIIWVIIIVIQPEPEPLPVSPVIIENGSTEEIVEIQNQAQQIYNTNPNINPVNPSTEDIETVDQLFAEIIDSPSGKEYPDQVRLAQLMFYAENNYYDQARKILDEITPSHLSKEQQALYYNYAGTIYNKFNENEKANEAYKEATNIRFELGGFGG